VAFVIYEYPCKGLRILAISDYQAINSHFLGILSSIETVYYLALSTPPPGTKTQLSTYTF
jgi:hypothetical protein